MSYLDYWKLNRAPFRITKNRRGLFLGGTLEEALARCEFLVDQAKQLGLVIGPPGVGKTTLFEHLTFIRSSSHPTERFAMVDMRYADQASLPIRLGNALGLNANGFSDDRDSWTAIQDQLFSNSTIGHRTVLILDNVSDASEELLRCFLKMWGPYTHGSTLMSVDDESIVNLPRWILDQCDLKIELPRWDLGQTADYFEFALLAVGGRDDLFDGQAITRIQELSDGIPRKIAQIADLSLVAGAVRQSERVTAELVDQVSDEFTVPMGPKFPLFWEDRQLNAG